MRSLKHQFEIKVIHNRANPLGIGRKTMRRRQCGGMGRRMGRVRGWAIKASYRAESGKTGMERGIDINPPFSYVGRQDNNASEPEALKEYVGQIKNQLQRINARLQELEAGKPSPLAVVNRLKCSGCGSCIDVCPVGAIVFEDIAVVGPTCTGCGLCVSECPNGAISLE